MRRVDASFFAVLWKRLGCISMASGRTLPAVVGVLTAMGLDFACNAALMSLGFGDEEATVSRLASVLWSGVSSRSVKVARLKESAAMLESFFDEELAPFQNAPRELLTCGVKPRKRDDLRRGVVMSIVCAVLLAAVFGAVALRMCSDSFFEAAKVMTFVYFTGVHVGRFKTTRPHVSTFPRDRVECISATSLLRTHFSYSPSFDVDSQIL